MHQLQREMSAREFVEWQQYYLQEPFGDDWMQAGTIAAATVNLWSKRKVKPDQFVPKPRQRKDPAEMEKMMHHWARLHNAKYER